MNIKQQDVIFLTKQFDVLDLASDEGYKNALSAHTFKCEHEGCDAEGTASDTVPAYGRDGKKVRVPLFSTFQLKVEKQLQGRDGNPVIDRDTGTVVTRQVVVLRQILCRKHADLNEPAAKKAGFFVQVYPLPANLDFLRRMGQEKVARDTAKEFFTAMAKGTKTVEDGLASGFILSLPPEGEETKPDENGELPNVLAIKGRLVGLIPVQAAKSYMAARKTDTELFNRAGLYLYWTTLAQARVLAEEHATKQAAWQAKMSGRETERKAREAEQAAAAARSQDLFAGLAAKFNLRAPEPAPRGNGDRRSKPREKRGEPRQAKKQELPPEASAQIREELEVHAEVVATAPQVASPEVVEVEPRGSQPPTLTASLASLAVSHDKR